MVWCEKKLPKNTIRRKSRSSIPEWSSVKYFHLNLGCFLSLLWKDVQKGGTVSWISANFVKNCMTRTFCSQPGSLDIQNQYKTSELVIQILLMNSNYWKQFLYGSLKEDTMKNEPCDTQTDGKKQGFCISLYILRTLGDVAGFIYEWEVNGECILIHYQKNNFIFN